MKKKPKLPDVTEKKLGREGAAGMAHFDDNRIEIDPRQSTYEYLNTELHEFCHLLHPDWSERKVTAEANKYSKFLWKQNYRKVKL